MSSFWRNLLCIFVGSIFGYIGFFIFAAFWPLVFPEPLYGSSPSDVAGLVVVTVFVSSSFVAGLLLCRRFTRRFFRDKNSITVLFR